jgi:1-acyl-sn-glycerol-3-phosphate acyltransferase
MYPALTTAFTLSYTFVMSERALLASAVRGNEAVKGTALQWSRTMCSRCDVQVHAAGVDRVQWDRPLVIVSNHQSHFDIPVIMAGLGRAFGFLTKSELFRVPAFGRVLHKLGCVSIDRHNKGSARSALLEGARRVRDGAQLVVFPEGTRTPDGTLQPFKKGPFYLIQEARVAAVPIAVTGTYDVLRKHERVVHPGQVWIDVGHPVQVDNESLEARERLRVRMHTVIGEMLAARR